jgi:serine protease Do
MAALALASVISFSGCATTGNGFSQFYKDQIGTNVSQLPPYSGSTRIVTISDPHKDGLDIRRHGYVLIGTSDFQSAAQPESYIKSQARKVGADLVAYTSDYLGSQQTTLALPQYNPGQTYTTYSSGTVNANAYGSGGYAYGSGNYYGSSTTTTPGTYSTQYVPVTVHRYEYHASFWRIGPKPKLGIQMADLPSEMRTRLERNTGALVVVVMNDSPAFRANIIEGDVLLKINGEDILSSTDGPEKITALAGQQVTLKIWRNGTVKEVSTQLNP